MRTYLAGAPTWVVSCFGALLYAVVWTGFTAAQDHRFGWGVVVAGVVFGVLMGLMTAWQTRRQRRRTQLTIGAMTEAERRTAARASATGTPPDDPALRRASVVMARDQLAEAIRTRALTIATCCGLIAISVGLAAFETLWYLLLAPVFVYGIVQAVRWPATMRRRIESLEAAG